MTIKKPLRTLLDIIVILFCGVFAHVGLLPMYIFPFFIFFILWLYLKLFKETYSNIGFSFSDINFHSFIVGGIIGLGYAAFTYFIMGPVFQKLGFPQADVSSLSYIKHNISQYFFLLAIACLIVIPYEEIFFRGFVLKRLEIMIPNKKWSFLISGLLTSILFAAYHYQEGIGAVISIFIFSLFALWLYKKFNGNLWYLIFFHVTYDIFMLTAIYWGYM